MTTRSFLRHSPAVLALALFLCASVGQAADQASQQKNGAVQASLLSEYDALQPGRAQWVAVKFEMDPGWHIYWRNPGDSGLTTAVEWTTPPDAVKKLKFEGPLWPMPEKFETGGIVSYGYGGTTYLLYKVTAPPDTKPGTDLEISASVSWLACQETCVPGDAQFSLRLPVRVAPAPARHADEIVRALASVPPQTNPLLAVKSASRKGEKLLALSFTSSIKNVHDAYFFPDAPGQVAHDGAQVLIDEAGLYTLTLPASDSAPADLSRISGVLSVGTGSTRETVAVQASLAPTNPPSGAPSPALPLSLVILYAYVGGLILNIMPCVLPVIALKIFQFVKQGKDNPRHIFQHGLVFASGILVSFLALAGLLLALRAGGSGIGWGFQFQSPAFLAFMATLVFVLGLSLFGVFELGGSLMGAGQSLAHKEGFAGSFFSGALATTLATPCTAPFMGAALGFALTQSAAVTLVVFLFLGLGMATPYLILASDPRLLRYIPKPGPWMVRVKEFTGFFMMGTALWLVWVFSASAGAPGAMLLVAFLLSTAVAAWAIGAFATPGASGAARAGAFAIAIAAVGAGAWSCLRPAMTEASRPAQARASIPSEEGISWQEWSQERVQAARLQGKAVFVDFTADWCLTCQVNERVVLANPEIVAAMKTKGVTALKADWTKRDPAITDALQSHGRSGVPLYIYYPPGAGSKPVVLPEILTPATVLDVLGGKHATP